MVMTPDTPCFGHDLSSLCDEDGKNGYDMPFSEGEDELMRSVSGVFRLSCPFGDLSLAPVWRLGAWPFRLCSSQLEPSLEEKNATYASTFHTHPVLCDTIIRPTPCPRLKLWKSCCCNSEYHHNGPTTIRRCRPGRGCWNLHDNAWQSINPVRNARQKPSTQCSVHDQAFRAQGSREANGRS